MDKNEATLWSIIVICTSIIFLFATYQCHATTRKYIENGYTHQTLPGSDMAQWVK